MGIVIANNNLLDGESEAKHRLVKPETVWTDHAECVLADVINEDQPTRHDPVKLAHTITRTYNRCRGNRTRLPRHLYIPSPSQRDCLA